MTRQSTARVITIQNDRLGRHVSPLVLEFLSAANLPWHEDAAAVRAGVRQGRKKARLLAWVRSQMALRLTRVERESIELYYFRGLNYRQAAGVLGLNASSVYRAVQRGLRKLRKVARENPPDGMKRHMWRKRRG